MADSQRQPGIPYPRLPLPKNGEDDLVAFQQWLEAAIPMVSELGIRQMDQECGVLSWQLAIAASLNDKGTGFGGALAAQTTLQGWCWVTLWLRQQGMQQDVVVAEASQRFMAPVTGDYRMICTPEDSEGTETLAAKLQARGKGSIVLKHQLYCDDVFCMEASGRYAVLPVPPE